jgi:F0F1-type ATP synthase delta subunit
MSKVSIPESSIISLLVILIGTHPRYEEMIDIAFVEGKMTQKLKVILSIVKTKSRAMEDIDLGKLIPDKEFRLHYVFPLIAMLLEDNINEMLLGLMEHAEQKHTEGDYLKMCDASKDIVNNFKKIKQVLETYEVFPDKMEHFRQY